MSRSLLDLQSFASEPTPVGWQALPRESLGYADLIAFDQSLSATGWVVLLADRDTPQIAAAGTISGTASPTGRGHIGNLDRAMDVYHQVVRLLVPWVAQVNEVVYEDPPVGPKMMRPEASLLAAMAIRVVSDHAGLNDHHASAQRGKALVAGNSNATKKEAHQALAGRYGWIPGFEQVTNEAQRDALLVGLTHLHSLVS